MVDKFNFNKCQRKGRNMSSFADRFAIFKNIIFLGFFAGGVVLLLLLFFLTDWGFTLSFIVATIIAGFGYMMVSDITKRDTLLERQERKDTAIISQIKSQRSSDLEKGTCISCRADLPDKATTCPKCGFDLTTITSREAKIDRLEEEDEIK
jgi:ribosomal protein L40E